MPPTGAAASILAEAVAALRAGRPDAARPPCERVLAAEPDNPAALYLLGLSHLHAGRAAGALPFLERAARLRADRADAHAAHADALEALGRRADAADARRRVVALRPGDADAWLRLGNLLHAAGRFGDALAAFDRVLALRGEDPDALNNRGAALRGLGRHAAAVAAYRQALRVRPGDVETLGNLAAALRAAGHHEEAVAASRAALALAPDSVAALHGLGRGLQALARPAEAADAYERVLAIAPDHVEAGNDLGTVLLALGRPADALVRYRRALAAAPGRAATLVNLGSALEALDRHADAIAAYRRAIAAAPDLADAHFNLGNALAALERCDEALAAFDRAVALRPEEAEFRFNRAHCHLALGRLEEGWTDFAFLWSERRMRRRPYPQPLWDGRPTVGKLVVWGEQGIGDEVLAAGLLGEAAARSGGVVVECDPRLVPLLRRSWPAAAVVPRTPAPDPVGLAADVAVQAPMVYLPMLLRRRWSDFPAHTGYLRPDPVRAAALRAAYAARGAGPIVGISWHSANPRLGGRKSLDLAGWAPILRTPGVTFVSLQYGERAAEVAAARAATGAGIVVDPGVDPLADIDGFAAQVAAMDLVITVSNSTAHFAGALGRPCWLLLPRRIGLLWYWLMCRGETCPWYPSLRVFRQDAEGQWSPVVGRVAAALARRSAG
ncbi:MAG: tetratricopeptide repeat protein [Alphaproteobacteria bacterium]|nr:tetratricopeptide repeat protein [Alphaproteobacteria bacterium]